jgi:hypothetical protein
MRRPGKTLCHIPTQDWMKVPASCGCGSQVDAGVAKVLGEPMTAPFFARRSALAFETGRRRLIECGRE